MVFIYKWYFRGSIFTPSRNLAIILAKYFYIGIKCLVRDNVARDKYRIIIIKYNKFKHT